MTLMNEKEILEHYKEVQLLDSISSLLGWDYESMMPKGSEGLRQQQSSALAKLRFQKFSDARFLESVMSSSAESPAMKILRKDVAESQAFDADFVAKRVEMSMKCQSAVSYTHLTLPTNREV